MSTLPDEDQTTFTEQPTEDRVLTINVISESARIYVLHQTAARVIRKDMATVLKKSLKELDAVDLDEFVNAIEAHAVEVEKNFIKIFSSEETNDYDTLRTQYIGGTTPIPTFDFELN
jgi:hypothetical protein